MFDKNQKQSSLNVKGIFHIANIVLKKHKLFQLMPHKFILEIKHNFNSDGKEQVEWATQGSKVPFVRIFAFSSTGNSILGYRCNYKT